MTVTCVHRSCRNRTTNSDGLCYLHAHTGTARTPGGQVAFRGSGVLSLASRVERERTEPLPRRSARVDGYPYLTTEDVDHYRRWVQTGDPDLRPRNSAILDRYPVVSAELRGDGLDGHTVVGAYDSDGDLHSFVPTRDGGNKVVDVSTDGRATTTLYATEAGLVFAVHSDQTYQLVLLDHDRLQS